MEEQPEICFHQAYFLGKMTFYTQTHGCEPSNLVTQSLRLNNRNFLAYSFVCVEIEGEPIIIFLDDDSRGLFYGLSADTSCIKITDMLAFRNTEVTFPSESFKPLAAVDAFNGLTHIVPAI